MRKAQCKQIKTSILEHVAPARYGKVSLNDVCRLFSHIGLRAEIEKCLDEFVKEKVANKIATSEGKFYIFEEIAREFGKGWEKGLEKLRGRSKELENEVAVLRGELGAMEKMRDMWLDRWENVLKDSEVYASVNNYVSSVVFGQYVAKVLDKLSERNKELLIVKKKTGELENRLRASYES